MKIKFIANPRAGRGIIKRIKIAEKLLKESGAEVITYITERRGDAEIWAKEAINEGFDRIVVAGGDGTINEVINGVVDMTSGSGSIPVGIIPVGISNVLALELGISTSIEKACRVALSGEVKVVPLGKVNGRYFSLMAGIGFDAEAVYRLKMRLKPYIGKLSYILSGLKVILAYKPPEIEVLIDSGETLKGYSVIIGKSKYYGGRFQVTPDAGLEKDELDICVFQHGRRSDILRYFMGILTKRHLKFRDVIHRKARRLKIASQGRVSVQIDGDFYGELPLEISLKQNAIRLVFPK